MGIIIGQGNRLDTSIKTNDDYYDKYENDIDEFDDLDEDDIDELLTNTYIDFKYYGSKDDKSIIDKAGKLLSEAAHIFIQSVIFKSYMKVLKNSGIKRLVIDINFESNDKNDLLE